MRDFLLALRIGLLVLGALIATGMAQNDEAAMAETTAWDRLVDQYFDDYYFPFHPSAGTAAGFHRYDSQLEDYSRSGVDSEIRSLKQARQKIAGFAAGGLTPGQQSDRELLLSDIDGRLLDLEEIRQWEKNPDRYSSGVTSSIFDIISRNFATPDERLKSVVARERQISKVFDAARANLKNPPKVYTEIALQQLPGITAFFQKDVPDAFKQVKDHKLLAEFRQTNQAVIESLGAYQKWLKDDLLPRSNGDFRIGADNYRKKLLYDEMVDTPLDQLLKIGYEDLHNNQERFKQTAARLDPQKSDQQLLAELQKDYPPPDKLLDTVRATFSDLRAFIQKDHIVTIPSPVLPMVEETPPFMRALSFASMDTPGPYERVAKEAFFNVTLPEKAWTPEHVRQFMAQFNYQTLTSVAVHEAYPGHYVQFLWVQNAPSKVRKLVGSGSNSEGWAHYCEQMMLDEGYGKAPDGKTTDKYLKLRLGQLQDALLRDARYIAGIEMHIGKMSFDQAVDFFVKEGYQSRAVAEQETKRGTSDATYLVYTLGKLQILKLREDYKQKVGDKFNLEDFHNQFLKQGFPPVKIIRKAMLGDDGPVL